MQLLTCGLLYEEAKDGDENVCPDDHAKLEFDRVRAVQFS